MCISIEDYNKIQKMSIPFFENIGNGEFRECLSYVDENGDRKIKTLRTLDLNEMNSILESVIELFDGAN